MISSQLGKYKILRTLGEGTSCKVKLGLDTATGNKYAIKILNDLLDKQVKDLVMAELDAMTSLNHKNILQYVEHGEGLYEKKNGEKITVSYIVLEIA